jgi:hypothetical protein
VVPPALPHITQSFCRHNSQLETKPRLKMDPFPVHKRKRVSRVQCPLYISTVWFCKMTETKKCFVRKRLVYLNREVPQNSKRPNAFYANILHRRNTKKCMLMILVCWECCRVDLGLFTHRHGVVRRKTEPSSTPHILRSPFMFFIIRKWKKL